MIDAPKCDLCGEPMPPGEEMFKYHGYSGNCPKPPLPKPTDDAKTRGLYRKFEVTRTDGSSEPGGKHYGCEYFVLDLTHDTHAQAALRAYANSCAAHYPLLAADLRHRLANAEADNNISAGGHHEQTQTR